MGNALSVDGSGDRVACGDIHDFTGTVAYTVEALVDPDVISNVPYLVQKADGTDGWALNITSAGSVRTFRRAASTTDNLTGSSTSIAPGAWVHVAATYDGTTLRVYLDGSLDGSTASSLSLPNTALEFAIGGRNAGTQDLDGEVDEVRVWDHARSQAEINDNKFKEVDPSSSGLIGYYKFDESSGAAIDSSPTGVDGTLTGDATRITSTAGLTLIASAAGASTSTGVSAAELIRSADASGSSTSTGTASALVLRQATATGTSTSAGTATADTLHQASASGASASTGQASALALRQATASGTSTSTGTADATVVGLLQATASGASTSTGTAAGEIVAAATLDATATGSGVSTGSATAQLQLAAVATGALQSLGNAQALLMLQASATGSSTSVGIASLVGIDMVVTMSLLSDPKWFAVAPKRWDAVEPKRWFSVK